MSHSQKQSLDAAALIRDAPKKLNCDYLRQLYISLTNADVEMADDVIDVARSLFLLVLDDNVTLLDRHLAMTVLQRMPPVSGLAELLAYATVPQLINTVPVLFVQNFAAAEVDDIVKKLCCALEQNNLSTKDERSILSFLLRISHTPYNQEDIRNVTKLLPSWMSSLVSSTDSSHFPVSSVIEIDGTESKDIFTVLNYAHVTNEEQFLNIQVFSMLKCWLLNVSGSVERTGKVPCPRLADLVSEDMSSAVQEYCLRLVDQASRKVQGAGMVEYQKSCLVEAIALLDVICHSDSSKVHSVLPTIKRIYREVSSTVLEQPNAKDVALLAAALQFFINHSAAVMYKHDNFYPFIFCDVLRACYLDSFAAFEIIFLMKENLAHLCYNSSVLEKYFPTFLEVLAWWPTTFLNDFLVLLPACMSQQTSIELFHSVLDLPCLSAALLAKNYKFNMAEEKSELDDAVFEILKNSEFPVFIKHMLRKCSGQGNAMEAKTYVFSLQKWHRLFLPLVSQPRVIAASKASISLLRCFFTTFLQYADESVVIVLFPVLLTRLTLVYPVTEYLEEAQKIFAEYMVQLIGKYPIIAFYCQRKIAEYLNHLKNYFLANECFIQLVWAVGEYVSVSYSENCRPDVIAFYFQNLEPTVYEIINAISLSSDNVFLKLINVSISTLSKLAARSQDLLPRALLCLGKAHHQIVSFNNSHVKGWKIVGERTLELLTILKTPNMASIILSPPKGLESGKLHRDATSLPFVLRAVTAVLEIEEKKS